MNNEKLSEKMFQKKKFMQGRIVREIAIQFSGAVLHVNDLLGNDTTVMCV